tara:strand:+ start:5295 stop:5489 length:195 start_codon:yes stop_codon:yes gene_type:complete
MARVRVGVVYQQWHDLLGLLSFISIKPKSLSTPALLVRIQKLRQGWVEKFLKETLETNTNVDAL